MAEYLEDDEPVLGAPNACVACRKLGTQVRLTDLNGELHCDNCYAESISESYKRLNEVTTGCPVNLEFTFQVKIGVCAKDNTRSSLRDARIRAAMILLGIPQWDDRESWEHELISMCDELGNEVPYDEDGTS